MMLFYNRHDQSIIKNHQPITNVWQRNHHKETISRWYMIFSVSPSIQNKYCNWNLGMYTPIHQTMFVASNNRQIASSLSGICVCFLLQAHTFAHPYTVKLNSNSHQDFGQHYSKHENKYTLSWVYFIFPWSID